MAKHEERESYYSRNHAARLDYQNLYNAVRRPLRRKVSKAQRANMIEARTKLLTGEVGTYNNDLTVKSTAPDPRWTGCQQDKERQLYDELRNALPLSSSREINDLRPSTSFSRFWNCNCALIAGDFEARLKYEVERIRDSLEWYALEGEWFGCQRSQDEVEEDVHGRVRIIACLHEGVELLRKGVFDRALEGGDLVYCGRRVHRQAFKQIYGF